jgi:c(7)-type cytochrome triheme protein
MKETAMRRILIICAALTTAVVGAAEVPAKEGTKTDTGAGAKTSPLLAAAAPATLPAPNAANAFNRLHKPAQRNLPPAEDGIHDAANDGTLSLQHPHEAFQPLPRNNAGNRVNWVGALVEKRIEPRVSKDDPKAEPVLMDLDIVREVKGSMPDVVYPHQAHTEWLDCSNCHPAIFLPEKGANRMSMAAIMLGEQCGVCHGKVAFPVSECRLCHSRPKQAAKAGAK